MISRPLSIAIFAGVGWMAAWDALALGFGRMPESVAFGRPLDLVVPLRLGAGESLSAACVQADVHVGAQRLPAGSVQVMLERSAESRDGQQLRLRSTRVVQEPLVAVHLVLGCEASVSRRFVVLADPLAAAPPMAAPSPPATPPSRLAERAAAVAPSMRRTTTAAAPQRPLPQLEEPEARLKAATRAVSTPDTALAAAAQAASDADAAAAELRLVALDTKLRATRDEAEAQRVAAEQMRRRLLSAEEQGRTQALLAYATAPLALLALWLGWRVRGLQRERRTVSRQRTLPVEEATPQTQPAVVVATPAAAVASRLVPEAAVLLPPVAAVEQTPAQAMSVDELIDLEQQAEFFLVLGDEEAAVELLTSQLRGEGGSSPLPHLKLLEIHRRRGDREACERLCRRFGRRFDAAAPPWDADPARGLELLHYPAALATLQAAWPRPPQAMAVLDRLLFPERGDVLLDLPACSDVLTLYAVARELHRQPELPRTDVDVLLPLAGAEAETPSIFDGLGASQERPTAPVNLNPSLPPMSAASR